MNSPSLQTQHRPVRWQFNLACFITAAAAITVPLLAQPANDNLADAITIGVPSITTGTTANATNDFQLVGACGNSAGAKDVWYRYNCTFNATVEFSNCNGTGYNSVIQAFTLNDAGFMSTEIACNDDACASQSRISFAATAGNSYIIRVAGYGTGSGAFTLTAQAVTPPSHPIQNQPSLPNYPETPARSAGADVTIGTLTDTGYYGGGTVWIADSSSTRLVSGYYSYAIGTDSWNIGDIPVEWQSANQYHPVIGQQMYRAKNGRLEQIGISWVKHCFSSTNSSSIPDMGLCDAPPTASDELGVNCSNSHAAILNGSRLYLGPRYDVNPTTGVFTTLWNSLVGTYSETDNIARRIAVELDDVRGDINAGSLYFVEGCHITQDDAQWGNARNNYSARILKADTLFNSSVTSFGNTYRRTTALELWAQMDPTVSMSTVDLVEQSMNVTDKWRHWTSALPDAVQVASNLWVTSTMNQNTRYLVGSKAINNGNGTYDYEYAVMNLNSHRAVASFALRLPSGAAPTNIDFKAPKYHSGERVLNNPWLNNAGAGGAMKWTVDPATRTYQVPGMTSSVTFNPNALMWGTLYNYRFTSTAAPTSGIARLGFYRAPNSTGYQGTSIAIRGVKVPAVCTADMGGQGGVAGADGTLDNNDFIVFIDAFFNSDMLLADVGSQGGIAGPDNTLDNNDFIVFIDAFFNGCGV